MKQIILEKTKKLFRFAVYMLLPILGGGWVGVSCTDTWDDHYESLGGGENSVHDGTIWQAITSDPTLKDKLSNFAKVIEGCEYVDRLNGNQVFTVFAPTNDYLTESQANDLIADYKAQKGTVMEENNTVLKQFIQNHMALYSHSFSELRQDTLTLMNGKYAALGNDSTINGVKMLQFNQLYNNGVLNVVSEPVQFLPNIFEAVAEDADLDSVRSFLYSNEEGRRYYYKNFLPEQSVPGSITDGKTQYLDSVFEQKNQLFDYLGKLSSEDSTYTMLAPTNDQWEKMIAEYEPYFQMPGGMNDDTRDSLQYKLPRLAIMEGTAFSHTTNPEYTWEDSIMSINSVLKYVERKSKWGAPFEYYQYYMPKNSANAKGVLNESDIKKCSNGELYKVSDWKIDPLMTFHQWIIVTNSNLKEVSKYYDKNTKDSLESSTHNSKDVTSTNKAYFNKLWNNKLLEFHPANTTVSPKIWYTLPKVLSNIGYDIYVVTAPALAADTAATEADRRPTKFKCKLYGPGMSKGVQLQGADGKTKYFETHPDSVDYFLVASDYKFPKATRGVDDTNLQIVMQFENNVSISEMKVDATKPDKVVYTRDIRINAILLVPHGTMELTTSLPATVGTGKLITKIPEKAQGTPGVLIYPHGKYDDRPYKGWYMQR